MVFTKLLLNEAAAYDMKNYADRRGSYPRTTAVFCFIPWKPSSIIVLFIQDISKLKHVYLQVCKVNVLKSFACFSANF